LAGRVVARANVGPRARGVAVGDLAGVTHGPQDRYVTLADVIDLNHPKSFRRLAAGGAAAEIAKQPDTANVYFTYWSSGRVGALDWGTGRLLWSRLVTRRAGSVTFADYAGNELWVTDPVAGRALLLDARDGHLRRALDGCPGADHVALAGTASVVVTCAEAGSIAIYGTRDWRRTVVPVGPRPRGVAVAVLP